MRIPIEFVILSYIYNKAYIENNGGAKIIDISRDLNICYSGTILHLKNLLKEGLIKGIRVNKTKRYILSEKGLDLSDLLYKFFILGKNKGIEWEYGR